MDRDWIDDEPKVKKEHKETICVKKVSKKFGGIKKKQYLCAVFREKQ